MKFTKEFYIVNNKLILIVNKLNLKGILYNK